MSSIYKIFILTIISILAISTQAQPIIPANTKENNDSIVKARLTTYFATYPIQCTQPNKLNDVQINKDIKRIDIYANEGFGEQPFREAMVNKIYSDIKRLMPDEFKSYTIEVYTDNNSIENLIPDFYRTRNKDNTRLLTNKTYEGVPWVKNISDPVKITEGLQDKHLLIAPSHGRYYSGADKTWQWQRLRLFCTCEDMLSSSFVLPYVIPMLQNAGAVVFDPRERDTQHNEVIVDNDTIRDHSIYTEVNDGQYKWFTPDSCKGFAWKQNTYQDGQNPFETGTYRAIQTENQGQKAFTEWIPSIPEAGKYAVYVSYHTLPNSVTDAKYEVFHKGGITTFRVNQQMGGGTWVYLGTFSFDNGKHDYDMVVLSNESKENGVITADAVRFGGGMGNIERGGMTSGLPRYLEGARYMAQWSGFSQNVYDGYDGNSDYKDDINTRSLEGNYLSGGSIFNPNQKGLNVPIELSLALHTDAGYTTNNDFIGSLSIFTTNFNNGLLNSGISRYTSRDFCDMMLTQINQDIDKTFNIKWKRRGMWDKNYSETREPASSSIILELLAHQNFSDVIYAHDPVFKFTVGRAAYKAILRYETSQHNENYVVAPLPVKNFAINFGQKDNSLILSWDDTPDPLEPSAVATKYKVYTRIDNLGFDNGVLTSDHSIAVNIKPGSIYSFKVAAVNHGGESFPSEILCAYKSPKEIGKALIINGFTRLSGPTVINDSIRQGFDITQDPGVPYMQDITLCGKQQYFGRDGIGLQSANGMGYSGTELEGQILAGNTFDYPFIHGEAMMASGKYSFISTSASAFEEGIVPTTDIKVIDLILGLQKTDSITTKIRGVSYKMLPVAMQNRLISFCNSGKKGLLISGSYIGSDMNETDNDRKFTADYLHYIPGNSARYVQGTNITGTGCAFNIYRDINAISYPVFAPDCLQPTVGTIPILRYADGVSIAGIEWKGKDKYRTVALGFPLESIQSSTDRGALMQKILQFFSK